MGGNKSDAVDFLCVEGFSFDFDYVFYSERLLGTLTGDGHDSFLFAGYA